MMVWAAHDAPHPIDLATLHAVGRAVPFCRVITPANRAVSDQPRGTAL
jgi:hypothetical protein